MTSDLLVNLIASAVAFIVGFSARTIYHASRKKLLDRNRRRIREQRHPSYTRAWLVDYYRHGKHDADLYVVRTGSDTITQVPLLMKESWNLKDSSESALLDQSIPQQRATIRVNQKVLKRRGRYLQLTNNDGEPWNDLIACAASVSESDSGPRIRLQVAEYFQFLSACGPLEDETYAAVRTQNSNAPIRDRVLGSAADAAQCRMGAHGFGMQVAVVFDDGERFRILVQRRSYSVSIYGGALAVVPVFGCQTTDLTPDSEISLFHNFLREVYEELYGGVEVERKTARVEPTWFYREAPIERLIKARETNHLDFKLLGFGFDALNGEMDVMALALFRDSRFTKIEMSEMSMNWEINNIMIWDLYGQKLTDAVDAGEFSPGSVYAITRARDELRDRHLTRS